LPPEKHFYGPHRSQYCELFLPAGDGPHPVAVLIHGGGYEDHYGRQLLWPLAEDLTRRGWAAWNVEYRRVGGGGGFEETHADVATAVDALADRPEPLDLRTIVAIGHSAGAQLALWLGARGEPITAVVAASALLDLAALEAAGSRVVPAFLGGRPHDIPDRYALASPAELLPLGVPVLLVHGDADRTVPVEHAERFAAAATRAGDACELVIAPGEDHVGPMRPDSAAWAAVIAFLEAQRP
jgi:acetyl esterase/lipase